MIQPIIDSAQFEAVIQEKEQALVIFWAAWCGSNRFVLPMFEAMSRTYETRTDLQFLFVDVDENPDLAQQEKVHEIPMVAHYISGKRRHEQTGTLDIDQLKAWLD